MRHLEKRDLGSSAASVLLPLAFIACMALISITVWGLLGLLIQV